MEARTDATISSLKLIYLKKTFNGKRSTTGFRSLVAISNRNSWLQKL